MQLLPWHCLSEVLRRNRGSDSRFSRRQNWTEAVDPDGGSPVWYRTRLAEPDRISVELLRCLHLSVHRYEHDAQCAGPDCSCQLVFTKEEHRAGDYDSRCWRRRDYYPFAHLAHRALWLAQYSRHECYWHMANLHPFIPGGPAPPEQYGYLPDGEKPRGKAFDVETEKRQSRLEGQDASFSVKRAIKTRTFWILAVVVTVAGAATNAVGLHVMPYLISVQIPQEAAGFIAASLAVSSVVGRLGFGWLGDRSDKRFLLVFALLLEALGLIIFAYTNSLASGIAFLVLFGLGTGGTVTLRLTIQGDYFGRKAFGSIQGVLMAIHTVGTIITPVLVGWVYDVQGSYQWPGWSWVWQCYYPCPWSWRSSNREPSE